MLLKLSKIRDGYPYRNPTIFFETPNRNMGNMIMIPTLSEEIMIKIINSNLLRGQNIKSIYTPFRFTPMKMGKRVLIPTKEYYENIFKKTNKKISIGRKTLPAYNHRNLIYDFNNEWRQTVEKARLIRGENPKTLLYLSKYFYDIMRDAVSEGGFDNNILIIPFDGSISNFRRWIMKSALTGDLEENIDPAAIIVRQLWNWDNGTREALFKNIQYLIFYNIYTNEMIKLDLDNIEAGDLKTKYINRIVKLYNNKGKSTSTFNKEEYGEYQDSIESEEEIEIKQDDKKEILSITDKDRSVTVKEPVVKKDIDIETELTFENVVGKFYENNKIKHAKIEPNSDPQETIYNKIRDDIKNNVIKGTNDIDTLINDPNIRSSLVKYAGLKKKETVTIEKEEENMMKELEIVHKAYNELPEIEYEKYTNIASQVDDVAAKDIRLKELSHTPISVLSKEYIDKQFEEDIIKVASSLSNNSILPLTLHKLEFKEASNSNNQMKRLYLGYKVNINGTNRDINLAINVPKIIDNHFLYINGNRWTVDNQLAFLPVTKTSPDSVKLTTNYTALFIDRDGGYLSKITNQVLKLIEDNKGNPKIEVRNGDNLESYSKNRLSNIDYSEVCSKIYSIKKSNIELIFNYDDMVSELKLLGVKEKYWAYPKDLIPFGFIHKMNDKHELLFLYKGKVFTTDYKEDKEVANSLSEFIYRDIYDVAFKDLPDAGNRMGYSKIKIAGAHYPMILILSMIFGLKNVIDRYKIPYFISHKREKREGYVEIKFSDVYLYYKDDIKNQILLNGLYFSKPEQYKLEDYNVSLPYDNWISTIKKISTSTKTHFKNTMRVTLNVLIDPITEEILTDQKLPTNILELLLHTNTLLSDNNYRNLGDVLNYRLRNYEQIAGMLNMILTKAYINYLNGYLRGNTRNTFEVGENELVAMLIKSSSVNTYSALSPVLELETYSRTSQKGFMGLERSDSYSQAMREFDDNKLSVYSAGATAFSGSVGITRSLTYQPHIRGIRGYIDEIEDIENTPDTRMLSASELLSPFLSRHSDASRQSMTIGQFKHNMPLNSGSVRLWSTGVERVVPGLLSSDFIFKAKKDGHVNNIDNEHEIVELIYNDNSKDYIDISTTFIRNSANAFYTPNKLIMRLKEKDRFKKDDVIAYNDVFFKDIGNGRVELLVGTLAKIAIAPIDNSFEDSTIISRKLSKKSTSRVVIPEFVSLTPTSKIKNIKEIGDFVDETVAIIEYDDFGDTLTDDTLGKAISSKFSDLYEILPSSTKYPNYHGIIKDIEVFYNVDKSELNKTLVDIINKYHGKYEKRLGIVGKDNVMKLKQKRPEQQAIGAKEDGEYYEGVLIKFYIQDNNEMGIGDKLSFDTALKGVVSNVLDDDEAPFSEHRPDEEIEAILTPTSIFSRLTHDLFYLLYGNKLLVELGRKIAEIRDK